MATCNKVRCVPRQLARSYFYLEPLLLLTVIMPLLAISSCRQSVYGLSVRASVRDHKIKVCEHDTLQTEIRISQNLQLRCCLGQRWSDYIL